MDVTSLNPRKAADANPIEVRLKHPGTGQYLKDEDDNYLVIEIRGKDSSAWRNAILDQQRANADRVEARTAQDDENDLVVLLGKCTVSISENIEVDGKAPDSAQELYENELWIAQQVLIEASNRNNLFLE